MDRYLAGEQVSEDILVADLEKAMSTGAFHPVVPVCATTGVGLHRAARPGGGRLPGAATSTRRPRSTCRRARPPAR